MKRTFLKVLLFCALVRCAVPFGYAKASSRFKRDYLVNLSPSDPTNKHKLEIQQKNLVRIEEAIADILKNSDKYSSREVTLIMGQHNHLDLTKPDALDDMPYFTKNSLFRYRVNKDAVKSVKDRIKYVRLKCFSIYEDSMDAFIKSKQRLLNKIGNSWRRSYIVSDSVNRPPIVFS